MNSPIAGLLAAALLVAGLVLLVLAWQRRRQARGLLIAGGWALMALSLWPWIVFGGPDRGLALALTVGGLAALAIIMRNGMAFQRARGAAAEDAEPDTRTVSPDSIPWLRRTWVALLAGPVAFASAVALAMVVFLSHGLAEADRVTLGGLVIPVAWGGLTTWAVSDPRLLRKSVAVIGIGLASGLAATVLAAAQ